MAKERYEDILPVWLKKLIGVLMLITWGLTFAAFGPIGVSLTPGSSPKDVTGAAIAINMAAITIFLVSNYFIGSDKKYRSLYRVTSLQMLATVVVSSMWVVRYDINPTAWLAVLISAIIWWILVSAILNVFDLFFQETFEIVSNAKWRSKRS
ncbi:MAG: hypothetical protein R3B41_02090 [Candidatus Doudnabacteria bacterium]